MGAILRIFKKTFSWLLIGVVLLWWITVNVTQVAQFVRDPLGMLFNEHVVGPLGMDDTGRWWFCREVDEAARKTAPDFRVRCEGKHNTTIVFSMKDLGPIAVGQVVPDEVLHGMRRPYAEMIQSRERLILTGDKWGWQPDSSVPMRVVAARLQELGATTVGDFYAACGFDEFLLRNEQDKYVNLRFGFSSKSFGENPVDMAK
jgi:hypothetical protein